MAVSAYDRTAKADRQGRRELHDGMASEERHIAVMLDRGGTVGKTRQ
uniref:Uncharacterized protein n=1 Tax=Ochrobactrum sp. LM19 TaxID=1449781 RepID=A0A0D5A029_9HYPH|nr:hypothetical protein pLM19O1_p22 [Ochrobactrum sp. LM19]